MGIRCTAHEDGLHQADHPERGPMGKCGCGLLYDTRWNDPDPMPASPRSWVCDNCAVGRELKGRGQLIETLCACGSGLPATNLVTIGGT